MVTNQDKWNEIVEWAINNRNERESVVEEYWKDTLTEDLGYSKKNGEIIIRPSISLGSSSRTIPDIIVSVGNIQFFMIELKQLYIPYEKKNEEQLFSYLRQTKGNIGVLICHDIYLYDYDYNKNDKEQAKFKIPFEKDNEDGIKFIELFSKEFFDKRKIKEFIQEKTQKERNILEIKKFLNDKDKDYVKNLIINDLSSLFKPEEIEQSLEDFNITIAPKSVSEEFTNPQIFTKGQRTPPINSRDGKNKVKIFKLLEGLKNSNQITDEMMRDFQNKDYSNRIFGLSHKLLTDNYNAIFDGRGHFRYYTKTQFSFNGKKYYVCSQWWEHCKALRDDFARKYGIDLENNKNDNCF